VQGMRRIHEYRKWIVVLIFVLSGVFIRYAFNLHLVKSEFESEISHINQLVDDIDKKGFIPAMRGESYKATFAERDTISYLYVTWGGKAKVIIPKQYDGLISANFALTDVYPYVYTAKVQFGEILNDAFVFGYRRGEMRVEVHLVRKSQE